MEKGKKPICESNDGYMGHSFDFKADPSVLEVIDGYVAEAGKKAGLSEVEIGDVQLAVDEACANTITHGLNKDPTRTFNISIRWKRYELEVTIREDGKPFNPLEVKIPDVDASLEARPIGGLGIYFMRKLMDEVEYGIDEFGIKTLRLLKKRTQKGPGPSQKEQSEEPKTKP